MKAIVFVIAAMLAAAVTGPAEAAMRAGMDVPCTRAGAAQSGQEFGSQRRWRRHCFGSAGRCQGFWRNGRKVVVCCR